MPGHVRNGEDDDKYADDLHENICDENLTDDHEGAGEDANDCHIER